MIYGNDFKSKPCEYFYRVSATRFRNAKQRTSVCCVGRLVASNGNYMKINHCDDWERNERVRFRSGF